MYSQQPHSARKLRSWKRSAQHHQLRETPRSVAAKTETDTWVLYKNKFGCNVYMSPDLVLHWSPPCHSALRSATFDEQEHVDKKCWYQDWYWQKPTTKKDD